MYTMIIYYLSPALLLYFFPINSRQRFKIHWNIYYQFLIDVDSVKSRFSLSCVYNWFSLCQKQQRQEFFLICVNSRFFRDKTRLPRTSAEFQNYSFKSINFHLINVWPSTWNIKVDRNVKEYMLKSLYKKNKNLEWSSSSSHCVRIASCRESEWVKKNSELEPVVSEVSYILERVTARALGEELYIVVMIDAYHSAE